MTITILTTEDMVLAGDHRIITLLIMEILEDGSETGLEDPDPTVHPIIHMVFRHLADRRRRRLHQAADLVQHQVRILLTIMSSLLTSDVPSDEANQTMSTSKEYLSGLIQNGREFRKLTPGSHVFKLHLKIDYINLKKCEKRLCKSD